MAEGYLAVSRTPPSTEIVRTLAKNLARFGLTPDQLIGAVSARAPRLNSPPGPGFWILICNQLANGQLLTHPHANKLVVEARQNAADSICTHCHGLRGTGEVYVDDAGALYTFQDDRWRDDAWITAPGRRIPCPECHQAKA